MLHIPFYNPDVSYEENFEKGPYGDFKNPKRFEREGTPGQEFLGYKVWQTFGIPAGPLVNSNYVSAAFEMGFDINVYKTVRTKVYECHPWPNVLGVQIDGDLTIEKASRELVAENKYREPLSITNSFGVPSKSPDFWQTDMKKAVDSAGVGQVMIGSFQGTKKENGGSAEDLISDYVLASKLVKETGTKILEANLSCPNEGTSELLCFDTNRVVEIAHRIKSEIGNTPLILKLAYFTSDEHLIDYLKKVGPLVEGLSVINTIASKIVSPDGSQALPGNGRERSGVCGAGIKWAGLDMVARLKKYRDELNLNFAIIGVGGVTKKEDYFEYKDKGADCIMSATGAMWNPYLGQEIWESSK